LQRIEESAFAGTGLKSIVLPASVQILGRSCFRGVRSLVTIRFECESKLVRIEELAFAGSGLKQIVLPHSVEFIDGSAFCFVNCPLVSISDGPSRFLLSDAFLQDISGQTIYRYFGNSRTVHIPALIIALCKSSFAECRAVASVAFQ
jgi:hypothetical protein